MASPWTLRLQAVIDGNADAMVVLENDLYTRTDSGQG